MFKIISKKKLNNLKNYSSNKKLNNLVDKKYFDETIITKDF